MRNIPSTPVSPLTLDPVLMAAQRRYREEQERNVIRTGWLVLALLLAAVTTASLHLSAENGRLKREVAAYRDRLLSYEATAFEVRFDPPVSITPGRSLTFTHQGSGSVIIDAHGW